MFIVVTYDIDTTTIAGRKRLNKIAKTCLNFGQRVQNSVFECNLDAAEFVHFRNALLTIIDKQNDSLRIYNLGKKYETKIEHYGIKEAYDPEGILFF